MIRFLTTVVTSVVLVTGTIALAFVAHALGELWGHPRLAMLAGLVVWLVSSGAVVYELMGRRL